MWRLDSKVVLASAAEAVYVTAWILGKRVIGFLCLSTGTSILLFHLVGMKQILCAAHWKVWWRKAFNPPVG